MKTTSLETAASEIQQACEDAGDDVRRSPFFVIAGAGISYPQVPLACTIIEHCQGVAGRFNRCAGQAQGKVLDVYSHWFELAYRQPRLRQKYLRQLIENKPISLANLRLAHLLSARKLTNLVVTTNFDDLLTKALRLFGQVPAVCDHPNTVARIDPDRDEVQIVHVHGSYLFYDFANLQGEVAGRAHVDQETSLTIAGLLDNVLWTRSPLVVGYSGWEGDVIMSALRRRLRGGHPLGQIVYWFCYDRTALDALPEWLTSSSDVQFVVPVDPAGAASDSAQGTTTKTDAGPAAAGAPAGNGAGGGTAATAATATAMPATGTAAGKAAQAPARPATLPAAAVFEQLIRAFQAEIPGLFHEPREYYARQLETLLPPGDTSDGGQDPYSVKAVIERLRSGPAAAAAARAVPAGLESRLDRLRDAVRRSRYDSAISICAEIIPDRVHELSPDQRTEVLTAADLAGRALLLKGVRPGLAQAVARALCVDPKLEAPVGPLPPDTVLAIGSRHSQMAYESMSAEGEPRGAFSRSLLEEIDNPDADRDRDGRISLLEAVIAASAKMVLRQPQTAVVLGDGSIALFSAKPLVGQVRGRLHSLAVGLAKYSIAAGMDLIGPRNDVAQFARLVSKHDRLLARGKRPRTLTDRDATAARIRAALKDLAAQARPEDTVLFYFSGRRDNQEGTLWAYDVRRSRTNGLLRLAEVVELLGGAKARQKVVIVD